MKRLTACDIQLQVFALVPAKLLQLRNTEGRINRDLDEKI